MPVGCAAAGLIGTSVRVPGRWPRFVHIYSSGYRLLMMMRTAWNVPTRLPWAVSSQPPSLGATSPKKKNTLDQHLSSTTQTTASSSRPSCACEVQYPRSHPHHIPTKEHPRAAGEADGARNCFGTAWCRSTTFVLRLPSWRFMFGSTKKGGFATIDLQIYFWKSTKAEFKSPRAAFTAYIHVPVCRSSYVFCNQTISIRFYLPELRRSTPPPFLAAMP